jgi:hypothetical protein
VTPHIPLFWEYVVYRIQEISSLDMYEYICIVAEYNKALSGRANDKELERRYTPEQLKALDLALAKPENQIQSCGFRFNSLRGFECPRLNYYLTIYDYSQNKAMPFEGGACDQPAQVMELFAVIDQLKAEHSKKR